MGIWDANPEIFVVSGWEECLEDKRKGWHLPPQFSYFSAGDMNLRVGIIATQGIYKDEDFLLGGIMLGTRLGNGARTVIYFVAQDFSPVFLGALAQLGGSITAKAVYWREKLTPSLYPVQEKNYHKKMITDLGSLRPGWEFWERNVNPVACNHLIIIRKYFEGLGRRRVRIVFEKNKLSFHWGIIEIAEIKRRGNKFELTTKVKWTRNKNIATKFLKSGWVDVSGNINEEFCRAISGILELLENMEVNGSLDIKDQLAIKLIYDKEFVPDFLGKYIDFPWLVKERKDMVDTDRLFLFYQKDRFNILIPVVDKPILRMVYTLLVYTSLESSALCEKGIPGYPGAEWNYKIFLLTQPELMEELRLCQTWLSEPEKYPIILLPEDWRTEGLKSLRAVSSEMTEDFFPAL